MLQVHWITSQWRHCTTTGSNHSEHTVQWAAHARKISQKNHSHKTGSNDSGGTVPRLLHATEVIILRLDTSTVTVLHNDSSVPQRSVFWRLAWVTPPMDKNSPRRDQTHHDMNGVVRGVVGDDGSPTQMFTEFRQCPFPLATIAQVWRHLQHKLLETLWAYGRAAQTHTHRS